MMASSEDDGRIHWFVMRDLKRANAKEPAYLQLRNAGFEVFTPLKRVLTLQRGQRIRREVPCIRDLLFVHDRQSAIDPIVAKTPTLQYRYKKGAAYCTPMTVPDPEMERFIRAVNTSENPHYFLPGELTPAMCGHLVQITGGTFDGYTGVLLSVRGSKTRRLVVELPGFLSVGVELENCEYLRLL